MLDVVIEFLLLFIEVKVIEGVFDDKVEIKVICEVFDEVLFFVFVFKIMNDKFVGNLIFVCVYFGVFK